MATSSKIRAPRTTRPDVPRGPDARDLINEIARRLEAVHRSPRLGNPDDPLDDLIFIILSGRTHGQVHQRVFDRLKAEYTTWEEALQAGVDAVAGVIREGGLSRKKAEQIVSILSTLKFKFGTPTLEPLRELPDVEVETLLCALPGVGKKTARCVMLYTLGRPVFPVDTHTIRILSYFGLVNASVRQEYAQDPLQEAVPPHLRATLHVNLVAHGRTVCVPRRPRCRDCVLANLCSVPKNSPMDGVTGRTPQRRTPDS